MYLIFFLFLWKVICRVLSTLSRRISLYLPIIWSRRATPGMYSTIDIIFLWMSCLVLLTISAMKLAGIRKAECCLWWHIHALQARVQGTFWPVVGVRWNAALSSINLINTKSRSSNAEKQRCVSKHNMIYWDTVRGRTKCAFEVNPVLTIGCIEYITLMLQNGR